MPVRGRYRARGGLRNRRPPEQGWSLLCNGIVLFDDGGLLLPDGRAEAPHTRAFHAVAA